MSYQIAYCDTVPARRQEVLSDLMKARGHVQVVDGPTSIPPEADVALVGVEDLAKALPTLSWLIHERPELQVLLLWEGDDQEQLIAAMREGVRDVIKSAAAVGDAVQRAWGRLAKKNTANGRPGKVIAIFSLKGGIGKSTLSANLPVAIHRQSRLPTTVVDMSLPCGNLEMYLDLRPACTVGDVLNAGRDLDHDVLKQALVKHHTGIHLLAGPRPDSASALAEHSSRAMFELLTETPGVTVVDVGSFLEEAHVTALEIADLVLIPVTPLISSMGTMPQAREFLQELGIDNTRIMPVLNNAAPESDPVPADVIARLMGERPRHILPWAGAEVAESLNAGVPLAQHAPKSPLTQSIDHLAHASLVRLGLADPADDRFAAPVPTGAFGWLKSMFQQKGVAHVRP